MLHMPRQLSLLGLLSLGCLLAPTNGFQNPNLPTTTTTQPHHRSAAASIVKASSDATAEIATLTEDTTWNLRLVLQNLPTAKGKKVDQIIFAVQAQFIEEEGYEPPQGVLRQINTNNDVTITGSRWSLSEDPDDRKDSLWIWGLFKDPLYPFLLLQMEVDEVPLPGEENDSIPAFKLFAQINHKRENGEVMLSNGADLKIKKKETMKADPFGAATVDIFEEISVGKLQLQPILNKS
jgi:hypothetical protein